MLGSQKTGFPTDNLGFGVLHPRMDVRRIAAFWCVPENLDASGRRIILDAQGRNLIATSREGSGDVLVLAGKVLMDEEDAHGRLNSFRDSQ